MNPPSERGEPQPSTSADPTPVQADPDPVREERALLCDALLAAGAGARTECEGWTAADLAAHLVVREGRPDTLPGIALRPLAFYTERARRRTVRKVPFETLVNRIRQGPPKWSPFALPGMDKIANGVEFFVHHEDVLRAQPDHIPRSLSPALEDLLWRRIKIARFALRKVPVEVTLIRPDGRSARVSGGRRSRSVRNPRSGPGSSRGPGATGRAARTGTGSGGGVRVHGATGELVLWALGRTEVAQVRITGSRESVKALTESVRGL
jgi:uncharacterized protein (TIGR03085 family)